MTVYDIYPLLQVLYVVDTLTIYCVDAWKFVDGFLVIAVYGRVIVVILHLRIDILVDGDALLISLGDILIDNSTVCKGAIGICSLISLSSYVVSINVDGKVGFHTKVEVGIVSFYKVNAGNRIVNVVSYTDTVHIDVTLPVSAVVLTEMYRHTVVLGGVNGYVLHDYVTATNVVDVLEGTVLHGYVVRTGVRVHRVEEAILEVHVSHIVRSEKTAVGDATVIPEEVLNLAVDPGDVTGICA